MGPWQRLPSASYPSRLPPEYASAARSSYGLRLNLTPSRLCAELQARAWRVARERTCPALVVRPGWLPPARPLEAGLQVDLVPEVTLGQNILVGFGGRDASDEVVLLFAHYDHAGVNSAGEILNGADDASGVGALLEVARALRHMSGFHRSVLLVFAAAELQGGQGGEMLLHDLDLLLGHATPVAAIGLDAVGRGGHDLVRILGADAWPALARVLDRHNDRTALDAPALLLEAQESRSEFGDPTLGVWKHASTQSLLQGAGIPSLLLNDGLDPLRSGLPDDDWQDVDVDKATRVARLVFRAVCDLTQEQGTDAAWAQRQQRP